MITNRNHIFKIRSEFGGKTKKSIIFYQKTAPKQASGIILPTSKKKLKKLTIC